MPPPHQPPGTSVELGVGDGVGIMVDDIDGVGVGIMVDDGEGMGLPIMPPAPLVEPPARAIGTSTAIESTTTARAVSRVLSLGFIR
jgi:hypothetical protein